MVLKKIYDFFVIFDLYMRFPKTIYGLLYHNLKAIYILLKLVLVFSMEKYKRIVCGIIIS